jgi:ABC-type nickel/cobalt efflux system permease component RcnA
MGLWALSGFSLGLAFTLVGVGFLVVSGLNVVKRWGSDSTLSRFQPYLPMASALLVVLSGCIALVIQLNH